MTRIGLGRSCLRLLPVLALIALSALPARGEDPDLRRRVLELNKITGTDVMRGEFILLSKDPQAKELVQAGVAIVNEKKEPLSYNAALILAQLAEQLKNYESSATFYRVCTAQAAKLQSTKKLLESYGALIDMLYNNKRYAESVTVCRELLELRTDDGKEREVLEGEITKHGELDYAPRENFDPVKRLRPVVYRLMIQSVAKEGKYKQALKMADKLIKDRKDRKGRSLWLEVAVKGWVQREAGQYAESAKTYEDVLSRVRTDEELDTEDRDHYVEVYQYILSNIYLEENRLDKVSELLQALLEKHPKKAGYHNDLGYIWADHDMKLPEAEKLILKALELDRDQRKRTKGLSPEEDHDSGAYLDSLGWVYYKQKKFKEAKEVLLKAIEDKTSQHIEIYDHLGDVFMALGEHAAALDAWRKGVAVAGDSRRDQERKALVEKKLQMKK
jgi:tetratricopeptide (TPR) repeat protein